MAEQAVRSNLDTFIADSVSASIELKGRLGPIYSQIAEAAEILVLAFERGGQAIFFGNGGSAADAQHFAAELVGRFNIDRAPLAALALNANSSTTTAIANDFGFQDIFARQLRAFARPGDVAVAISTSGNSPNVLAAARLKSELNIKLIALTGEGGGELGKFADVLIAVPSKSVPRIQEAHGLIGHILCEWIERTLKSKNLV